MQLAKAATAAGPSPATPESLGRELREALNVPRLQSLSIHNAQGDALWLSEGALGPDEHTAALDGMAALGLEPAHIVADCTLDDTRSACFLALRSQRGDLVGVAMLILDGRMTAKRNAAKIATPQVNDVLRQLAELSGAMTPAAEHEFSRAPAHGGASATAAAHAPAAAAEPELALQSDEDFSRALDARTAHEPSRPAANGVGSASPSATWASDSASHARPASKVPVPAAAAKPAPTAHATTLTLQDTCATLDDPLDASFIAEVRIEPPADEATVIAPRIDTSDLMLVVQQLLKLRSGGRTRRFEVLLRSRKDPTRDAVPLSLVQSMSAVESGSIIDRHVLSQLIHWLAGHRAVWEAEPASFSINLATDTLGDAGLLHFAASRLEESRVTPQVLGFEIPERACIERPQETRRFVEDCEKLGCYFVLDDFTMHSSAVPFLASPALRLVKLDAKLTGSALNDKLSQAIVIAISQASKVLGVHCVVKRIDSTMARQWFAAIGIDFAQGFALERPQSLEALALAAAAKKPTH